MMTNSPTKGLFVCADGLIWFRSPSKDGHKEVTNLIRGYSKRCKMNGQIRQWLCMTAALNADMRVWQKYISFRHPQRLSPPARYHLPFCIVEGFCFYDASLDLLLALLGLFITCFFGKTFLVLAVVEDGWHVLARRTPSGVMVGPKQLEHFTVVGLCWIVLDLDRLRVIATGEIQ